MTTDPFTTAALDSAANKYASDWDAFQQEPVDDWGFAEAERRAFVDGAVWARTLLATQEPTDAECLAVLNVAMVPLGEPPKRNDLADWNPAAVERVRAALSAARKA